MNKDEILQKAVEILTGDKIAWAKLSERKDFWDAKYFSWYYADNDTYIFRDNRTLDYGLIKAHDFIEALEIYKENYKNGQSVEE